MLILLLQRLLLVSATFLRPGEHLQHPFSTLQVQTEWELLRSEVGDRLSQTSPFASACYDAFDSEDCVNVRNSYLNIGEYFCAVLIPICLKQASWEQRIVPTVLLHTFRHNGRPASPLKTLVTWILQRRTIRIRLVIGHVAKEVYLLGWSVSRLLGGFRHDLCFITD